MDVVDHGRALRTPLNEPRNPPGGLLATNPCWTCRRKRVKCDGILPACRTCSRGNRQCLGYGRTKPLVWAGIASRGKMMGKTFTDIYKSNLVGAPQSSTGRQISAISAISDTGTHHVRVLSANDREMLQLIPLPPGSCSDSDLVARLTSSSNSNLMASLIDPGLQDLSPTSRGYISYFERQCSKECVLFDSQSENPFREFMRLMPYSPSLRHIIIAVAALHLAHRDATLCQSARKQSQGISTVGSSPVVTDFRSRESQPSYAHHDALLHKHKALYYLRNGFTEALTHDYDAIIASVLLFIWFETLESGKQTWKHHLDGVRELMRLRTCLVDQQCWAVRSSSERTSGVRSFLQDYFDATYAVFDIIGSTLVKSRRASPSVFTASTLLVILKRAETLTWVGCPSELLHTLSLINSMTSDLTMQSPGSNLGLFTQLDRFSPIIWAIDYPETDGHEPRYHLACAYKIAVEIYAYRVMGPLSRPQPLTDSCVLGLVDSAIMHLAAISPQDTHFKSLIWPSFITGAEAATVAQMITLRGIFGHLWEIWRCQNVKSALEVLESIWAHRSSASARGSWINDLYEKGEDWLFI